MHIVIEICRCCEQGSRPLRATSHGLPIDRTLHLAPIARAPRSLSLCFVAANTVHKSVASLLSTHFNLGHSCAC